jgi:hypothetical protein
MVEVSPSGTCAMTMLNADHKDDQHLLAVMLAD